MSALKLRAYQHVAVAHLRANPRAGLLLDMGLGKTAVALTALTTEHLPVLVCAPKRVAEEVWDEEVDKWRPDLRVGKAIGAPAQRKAVLEDRRYDVVVISRDNLADAVGTRREWRTLILDESSGFKAQGTTRWKTAKRIIGRGDVDHVWELTGTPAPNGLDQLWAQMYLLDNGKRMGRTFTVFRDRHMKFVRELPNKHRIYEIREGHEPLIHAEIEDICMSMKNEGLVDLPPVTWNTVNVPLPPKVMQVYRTLKDKLVVDMNDLGLGDMLHTAETAGALSNRLRQIASGFLYEDKADAEMEDRPQRVTWLHTERAKAVRAIVEEAQGSPVMVAYCYRPELEMLKKEFGKLLHTADEPNVFKRWNRGQVPVLAAHPASVGHGLNLQHGGHTAVWMSATWDLELWDQFNARLPRSGQTHPVVIHMLSSPGTLDPKVYAALRTKGSVQQALLDYLESPV